MARAPLLVRFLDPAAVDKVGTRVLIQLFFGKLQERLNGQSAQVGRAERRNGDEIPVFAIGRERIVERPARNGWIAECQNSYVSPGSNSFNGFPNLWKDSWSLIQNDKDRTMKTLKAYAFIGRKPDRVSIRR